MAAALPPPSPAVSRGPPRTSALPRLAGAAAPLEAGAAPAADVVWDDGIPPLSFAPASTRVPVA